MLSRSKFKLGKPEDCESFLSYVNRKVHGIKTGLPSLDASLLGLQGIVSLVGEPKACKSTLALQIALHNARQGVPVFFIDRENGWHYMEQRIISNFYDMPWQEFCRRSDEIKLKNFQALGSLPFELCTENFTQADLDEVLTSIAAENPNAQQMLLVIDSLHKLPMQLDNMRSSVDGWLLFLDYLKLKFNRKLTILITCEKRRGAYGEAMRDAAKESGRIEYTVEQQFDMRINRERKEIILECMYNRHGPADQSIILEKVCKGGRDDRSFIFKLREQEVIPI